MAAAAVAVVVIVLLVLGNATKVKPTVLPAPATIPTIWNVSHISELDETLVAGIGDYPVGTEVTACDEVSCRPALVVAHREGKQYNLMLSTSLSSRTVKGNG
jgi:hypothetical protein